MKVGFTVSGRVSMVLVAALSLVAPADAGQPQGVAPAVSDGSVAEGLPLDPSATPDKKKVQRLASLVCANLAKVKSGKALDLEASIASTLSQRDDEIIVRAAALLEVENRCPMIGLQAALGGVGRALRTGGLDGTAGIGFGESSDFGSPFVNVGGGSVNYTTGG